MGTLGTLVLTFLPDEALILVPVAAGFLVILGLLKPGKAFSIIGGLVLLLILTPFIAAIFDALPLWICIIALIWFGYSIAKALSDTVMGKGVADHFWGSLLFALFCLPFRLLAACFRMLLPRGRQ